MIICPKAYKLCQSDLKTLPKTKKTLNILLKTFNICQSGGFSPNVVTLRSALKIFSYHSTRVLSSSFFTKNFSRNLSEIISKCTTTMTISSISGSQLTGDTLSCLSSKCYSPTQVDRQVGRCNSYDLSQLQFGQFGQNAFSKNTSDNVGRFQHEKLPQTGPFLTYEIGIVLPIKTIQTSFLSL